MLKIRLQRVGRKHESAFRLVLTDSTNSTKSGRFKEILGSYDPRTSRDALKADRIKYWVSQGANLTPTVNNLLVTHKIISGSKIHVSTTPAPAKSEESPEATTEAPAQESVASESQATESAPESNTEPKEVEADQQAGDSN